MKSIQTDSTPWHACTYQTKSPDKATDEKQGAAPPLFQNPVGGRRVCRAVQPAARSHATFEPGDKGAWRSEWSERIPYDPLGEGINGRKRDEKLILLAFERLRALLVRLHSVREQERVVLARELHDRLGQALTALKIDLAWLKRRLPAADVSDLDAPSARLEAMTHSVDSMIASMRDLATELRPAILDKFGLVKALEWQLQEFQRRTGIACSSQLPAAGFTIAECRSTALFRVFQEILCNVARHASATKVCVSLRRKAGELCLTVRDNGCGISKQAISNPASLGLLGMRERVQPFGGQVVVSSSSGNGTSVLVEMPLERSP